MSFKGAVENKCVTDMLYKISPWYTSWNKYDFKERLKMLGFWIFLSDVEKQKLDCQMSWWMNAVVQPFHRQIIQFEFSHTWSCVSLTRSTTSSEWKLFRFDKMEVNSSQILLIDVTFYL